MDKKGLMPTTKKDKNIIFLITYTVILVVALLNMNSTLSFLGWVFALLNPFLIGLVIAYIINIIMTRLETKVFAFLDKPKFKLWKRIKRPVCMILSILIILAVLTGLILFIVPQLIDSMQLLSANMPTYVAYLQQTTNGILARFGLSTEIFGNLTIDWSQLIGRVTDLMASVSPKVLTFATNFTSMIFNFFMGIIFAIYMLLGKENIIENIKRTMRAYMPKKAVDSTLSISSEANKIFASFLSGQLTEAVILGVMYFIGTSIFRMPYSLLVSSLMALGGLIPMFGPVVTAIIGTFIIAMVDFNLAIIFVIMAVVFQQIEGNIIYPRVLGSSVGLPGIWVLLAILVGGNLGGAFGMIISVPIASLIYSLLRSDVIKRLKENESKENTMVKTPSISIDSSSAITTDKK